MSGGAFQYAFTRVQQFADDVRERIAEHPKSFSDAEVERLRLLAEHCGVVADWMKAAEWLASGDTGEDVFLRDTQGLARIAELEADAGRYRWLREQGDYGCTEKDGYGGQRLMTGEQLDAAIDAARSQEARHAAP